MSRGGTVRDFVLVLLVCVQIGAGIAAPAEEVSGSYNFRWFQTDAGLPESTVNAMVQTPDGYIWCATFNGLARFDGVRFVTFDPSNTPELPTDRVTRLGVTKSGALVVVTEFGDVVVRRAGRTAARPIGRVAAISAHLVARFHLPAHRRRRRALVWEQRNRLEKLEQRINQKNGGGQ